MNKKKYFIIFHLVTIIVLILTIMVIKEYKKSNKWYSNNKLIGHALYGIDNQSYTNSYEALELGYNKGIRVFEADFLLTSDEKLILKHDWKNDVVQTYDEHMSEKIKNKYTPMDIKDLLLYMKEHEEIYIVVDTKQEKYDATKFLDIYSKIVETAQKIEPKVLDRVIIQIYKYEDLAKIKQIYTFKDYIFTTYKLPKLSVEELITFCVNNNVETIVCPQSRIYNKITLMDINNIKMHGINIYVHTVNEIEKYREFVNIGIDGIYTDFINI